MPACRQTSLVLIPLGGLPYGGQVASSLGRILFCAGFACRRGVCLVGRLARERSLLSICCSRSRSSICSSHRRCCRSCRSCSRNSVSGNRRRHVAPLSRGEDGTPCHAL